MTKTAPFKTAALGFPWRTRDPFLFCVHHLDLYPQGNDVMGPVASLDGRNIGMDFEIREGFRMYHGHRVPGFPAHPHRGFETITLARQGYIDHSDSLGARARFGKGDVQWMTAGQGIVHAEMFPLVKSDAPNPGELFQIWLNLPARNKMVEAHFKMLWGSEIPKRRVKDAEGRTTEITVVAGVHGDARAPAPPPKSWASEPDSEVAVWTLVLEPHAEVELPAASVGVNRSLYFFDGASLRIGDRELTEHLACEFDSPKAVTLKNGPKPSQLLLLQGRPIGEPVVQHGPFVMNTREEIQQAMFDYQRTQFGGWPWSSDEPVHKRSADRFAQHVDGRVEWPPRA